MDQKVIIIKISKYFELNDHENTTYQKVNASKVMLRGNF